MYRSSIKSFTCCAISAIDGWKRKLSLSLGRSKNQKAQLPFLPPRGDGRAAPAEADRTVMSHGPVPPAGLANGSVTSCVLRLGAVTVPPPCPVAHGALCCRRLRAHQPPLCPWAGERRLGPGTAPCAAVTFCSWLRCDETPRTLLQLRLEMNACAFSARGPRFDSSSQKAAEGQRVTFSASSEIL